MENSRRKFIKNLSGSVAAITIATDVAASNHVIKRKLISSTTISSNDKIRIGLIGAGIIGHYDTDAALKVDGVELAAVCDLYRSFRQGKGEVGEYYFHNKGLPGTTGKKRY